MNPNKKYHDSIMYIEILTLASVFPGSLFLQIVRMSPSSLFYSLLRVESVDPAILTCCHMMICMCLQLSCCYSSIMLECFWLAVFPRYIWHS